jgi:hypothetical protein
MSEATFEATESEALEGIGEAAYEGEAGEASYEGEGAGEAAYEGWGEDARSDARRRARQRQIMVARQRQAQLRRRPAPPRPVIPAPSQAVRAVRSEVRSLDLDTKVALDSLRSRLDQANRLAYRNAWAAEASAAASQVLDSFETGLAPHDWARAIIRGAPTLLLAPGKARRPGLEGVLFDPRVAGGALLAGIWAIGHFRGASSGVAQIRIANPSPVAVGTAGKLTGIPVDRSGRNVSATVTWTSDNSDVLDVKPTGDYEAGVAGTATVTATADDVSVPISVKVK